MFLELQQLARSMNKILPSKLYITFASYDMYSASRIYMFPSSTSNHLLQCITAQGLVAHDFYHELGIPLSQISCSA